MEDELQVSQHSRHLVCDVRGSRCTIPDAEGGDVQELVLPAGEGAGLPDTGGAGNAQFSPGYERRGEKGMAATKAVSDSDSDRTGREQSGWTRQEEWKPTVTERPGTRRWEGPLGVPCRLLCNGTLHSHSLTAMPRWF